MSWQVRGVVVGYIHLKGGLSSLRLCPELNRRKGKKPRET